MAYLVKGNFQARALEPEPRLVPPLSHKRNIREKRVPIEVLYFDTGIGGNSS